MVNSCIGYMRKGREVFFLFVLKKIVNNEVKSASTHTQMVNLAGDYKPNFSIQKKLKNMS